MRSEKCREMADAKITKWGQRGVMSLWHYEGFPRNYPGYHLTANSDGCAFLIGLFKLFRNAKYPARRDIALNPPSSAILAIPNCHQPCVPARRVEFRFRRDFEDTHWTIAESRGEVVIELGMDGLNALEQGASDMLRGEGDWCIGAGTESLWFWWHPETLVSNKRVPPT